jgi:SSS family solute:Na+ symporter/sodium/proline symporter
VIYLAVVALYLVLLAGVSFTRLRAVKTQDDFMVAGRAVPWYLLVGTLVCTWIGSGSLFAGAGRAFREGFSALWFSGGAWVGIAIVYFLAGRVRRIAQYTVPDLLETRYHPAARLLGTVAIAIAYLTIAGYQFIGGGRLLNVLYPSVDPDTGKGIVCLLVIVFTVTAGMLSIVALDVINGLVIIVSILIAAPLALSAAGGIGGLVAALPETHFTPTGKLGILPAFGLFFPTLFLLLGESSMYQKFFAAKDENAARKAVVGMIVGVVLVETLLDTTAIFAAGSHWTDPRFLAADGTLDTRATETVLLVLARHDLPVVAGCLLLAGAVAIVFSTATTFLMVPSTSLARDVYQRFVNPGVSERGIILFQRVSIVVLAGAAYLLTTRFSSILEMALYAYTMVGAAVTPALLAAFLWKRATAAGGVASIASGIVATLGFGILNRQGWESLDLVLFRMPLDYDYIIYPAATASIASLVIVSLLTEAPPESKWKQFVKR